MAERVIAGGPGGDGMVPGPPSRRAAVGLDGSETRRFGTMLKRPADRGLGVLIHGGEYRAGG